MSKKSKDVVLLKSLTSGDAKRRDKAFQKIYKTVFPKVNALIVKKGGTEEDALDIFQDAVLIFYDHINNGRFRSESLVSTYIYGISKNLWHQFLRKRSKMDHIQQFEEDNIIEITLHDHKGLSATNTIEILLKQLDPNCREILKKYYYENRSMQEIQAHFSLGSTQAAKNKKYRCLKKLVELFKSHGIKKDAFTPHYE